MVRSTFDVMGTFAELVVDATDGPAVRGAVAEAEAEAVRLEGLLSRFRDDSELARINRDGGGPAGPEVRELLALALDARRLTGGRFDPAVGGDVIAAGYDRSFDRGLDADEPPAEPPDGFRALRMDADGLVSLSAGVRLDLGGIAKGWAAERLAGMIAGHGPCLVSLGGDVAVRGVPRDTGEWPVGVPVPGAGSITLGLAARGLATSGADRRRWTRGGREMHHIVDPATGRPTQGDLVRVTCVASDAAWAEVWAKALLIAGAARARDECRRLGMAAVLVRRDGTFELAGGLA